MKKRIGFIYLKRACTSIAKRIDFDFERIVAISRGGLLPAILINNVIEKKRKLKPMLVIGIRSYKDDFKRMEKCIIYQVPNVKNEKILIVDDIADTGNTLLIAKDMLKEMGNEVFIATIFYKKNSKIKPNVYYEKTDKWIVFPWEL